MQQYQLADEQLARAERRVRAGDAAEVEVIRAESGLAARVEAIIIADAAVRQANRTLKRVLNSPTLPISGRTRITPMTEPDPVGLDLDPARLTEFALQNRMEMLELEIQLAIDSTTIDFRENQLLPLFTVDYTYRLSGLGLTLGDAFDQVARSSFADWTLALTAEIPIGNDAAEARLQNAVLARIQRLATRDQRTLAIRQEVYDAWDTLTQSWQRIIAARRRRSPPGARSRPSSGSSRSVRGRAPTCSSPPRSWRTRSRTRSGAHRLPDRAGRPRLRDRHAAGLRARAMGTGHRTTDAPRRRSSGRAGRGRRAHRVRLGTHRDDRVDGVRAIVSSTRRRSVFVQLRV